MLNYIDDFVGAEYELLAWESYNEMGTLLEQVGIPESPGKAVPPSQLVEFLGILFNVKNMTIEISNERLREIMSILQVWENKTTCTRRELEQLIGKLQFAAACVRPGRIFICRLLNVLCGFPRDTPLSIPSQLHKDVLWWKHFMKDYNGVSIMWPLQSDTPDEIIATDASGSGAGGILWGKEYFRVGFHGVWIGKNIAYLEMLAIIVALKLWGGFIAGRKIIIQCDNMAVVEVINRGRSRDLFLQASLRKICFLLAKCQGEIRCVHIRSELNEVPDMLSRWR